MFRKKDLFPIQKEESPLKLNRHSNTEWVEESFCTETHGGIKRIEDIGENNFLGISLSENKINLALFSCWFILMILLGRCFFLQVVKGAYYRDVAQKNRVRERLTDPNRGILYDRYGNQLVENIPTFSLYLVPADLPRDEEERSMLYEELYVFLEKYQEELEPFKEFSQNIEKSIGDFVYYSYRPTLVRDGLGYEEAMLLKIAAQELPGVEIHIEGQRRYLLEYSGERPVQSLSHIFGYMGRISEDEFNLQPAKMYKSSDYIGKSGLEQEYEKTLRGIPGTEQIEVDAIGKPKKILAQEKPLDGKNLYLSLDLAMQAEIEHIVNKHLEENELRKASVIVMDPNTGELLALVSLPSYDINWFARGITQKEYSSLLEDKANPLFNRSISGEYPSGSTFKTVVAAAALEEGIVNFNTLVSSIGGIRIKRWFFPDWKAGGHGLVNVTRAIAESVNTFFYLIGGGDQEDFKGLGVRKIKEYASEFGISRPLGIDLPGEKAGFLPDPEWKEKVKKERWYIGDTYHFAIGQGDILVTPLQVAAYTSVFANEGKIYRPHFVQKIVHKDGKEKELETEVLNENFISKENIETVRYGMRKTVTTGSARSLSVLPLNIAGKTGTAQWGRDKVPHSWFTSFAPFEKPEIVVTVLVEEGGEGSEAAVPISRKIYEWYYNNRVEK